MKTSWKNGLDSLVKAGTSKSTLRAHARDIRYVSEWLTLSCGIELTYPLSLEHVIGFIVEHSVEMPLAVQTSLIERGLKKTSTPLSPRTIRRIIGSLSALHIEKGVTNTCAHDQVRMVLKKLTVASTITARKKVAITQPILSLMLATCQESLVDKRDRALLNFAVTTGGRRRSELINISIDDLEPIDGGYLVTIRKSKSDQAGDGHCVPLLGQAALDVKAWLLASGIRSGKLFRGIHRSGRLRNSMCGDTVNTIVKQRARMAGFDETCFSAHGLRSGFVTQAGRSGIHIKDVMQLSLHRDVVVAQGYYKEADVLLNPASAIFIDDAKDVS